MKSIAGEVNIAQVTCHSAYFALRAVRLDKAACIGQLVAIGQRLAVGVAGNVNADDVLAG